MARMRTLKPEACSSESLCEVPREVRWTFATLWTHCDDEGRAVWNPRLVKAALYPLDDDVTVDVVVSDIEELAGVGAVCLYEVDGKDYLHVPSWHEHQHPNRSVKSKIPPCPGGAGEDHVKQHPSTPSSTTHVQRSEPTVSAQPQRTPVVVVVDVDGEVDGGGAATEVEPHASAPRPPTQLTVNQRAQRLATSYTDQVPMSKFPAVMGIAKRAIEANHPDDLIEAALLRLAAEGRSLTVETLRIEIEGRPPPQRQPKRNGDDRVHDGLALAQRLAGEQSTNIRQIGASS